MWKREVARKIISKIPDARCECSRPKHMILSIGAEQQCQTHLRQHREEFSAPQGCALFSWRSITARHASRIAKAHRHNCHSPVVVKVVVRKAHPLAQPIAGCIGEGNAGLVGPASRSLTNDEDGGARRRLQKRTWAEGQSIQASRTRPHPLQQRFERYRFARLVNTHSDGATPFKNSGGVEGCGSTGLPGSSAGDGSAYGLGWPSGSSAGSSNGISSSRLSWRAVMRFTPSSLPVRRHANEDPCARGG